MGYSCTRLPRLFRLFAVICTVLVETGNSVEVHPYLLFSTQQTIYKALLNGTSSTAGLLTPQPSGIDRLSYHYRFGMMYWISGSRSQRVIMSASINGSDVQTLISNNLDDPADLAVDWINNKLCWVDLARREISEYDLVTGHRRLVLSTGEPRASSPSAIALYPYPNYGWVYWSDGSRLMKASVTGDDRSTIRSDLNCVNVLTIDYSSVTIYWIDHCQYAILSLRLDGDATTHTYPFTDHAIFFPRGLVIKNNTFYWAEPSGIYERSNAVNAVVRTVQRLPRGSRATGLQLVHETVQPQAEVFVEIISPTNATTTFQCSSGCVNGSCIPPGLCACNTGWRGAACDVDLDECSRQNGLCDHNCHNMIGHYFCTCRDAFTLGDDLHSCADVNECDQFNGGCDQNCSNTIGSYYCTCRDGYRLANNNHSCEDVDECLLEDQCHHVCTNLEGSFRCSCYSGYYLNSDGVNCIPVTPDQASVTLDQPSMDAMYTTEILIVDAATQTLTLSASSSDSNIISESRKILPTTYDISTPGDLEMTTTTTIILHPTSSTSQQSTSFATSTRSGVVVVASISKSVLDSSSSYQSMETFSTTYSASQSLTISSATAELAPTVVRDSILGPYSTAGGSSSLGTSKTDGDGTTTRRPTPSVQSSQTPASSPTSIGRHDGTSSSPQPTFTPNPDVDIAPNKTDQGTETTVIAVTVTLVVVCLLIAILALLIAIVAVRRKHRKASYSPDHKKQTSMTLNVSVKKISSTFSYTSKPQ